MQFILGCPFLNLKTRFSYQAHCSLAPQGKITFHLELPSCRSGMNFGESRPFVVQGSWEFVIVPRSTLRSRALGTLDGKCLLTMSTK